MYFGRMVEANHIHSQAYYLRIQVHLILFSKIECTPLACPLQIVHLFEHLSPKLQISALTDHFQYWSSTDLTQYTICHLLCYMICRLSSGVISSVLLNQVAHSAFLS